MIALFIIMLFLGIFAINYIKNEIKNKNKTNENEN